MSMKRTKCSILWHLFLLKEPIKVINEMLFQFKLFFLQIYPDIIKLIK